MPVLAVPVKPLQHAKSRLAGLLSARERASLTLAMAQDVLAACLEQPGWDTWAVSRDTDVLFAAEALGAKGFHEKSASLLGAVRETEAAVSGDALALVLADLPLINAEALDAALRPDRPVVAVRAASDGGTNVLLRRPATVIPARFGRDSFAKHAWAARRVRLRLERVERAELEFDLDIPRDVAGLLSSRDGGRAALACRRMGLEARLRALA